MATIKKHNGRWRAQVAVKGKRASKVCDTKSEATLWAIEIETVFRGGKHTVSGYSVGDAFRRYAKEISPSKKGERWEVIRLGKLCRDRLALVPIERIETQDLQDWIDRQTISDGSIIRELNLIQSVLKQARRWRWTNADATKDLQRPKQPSHRDRLISDVERDAMLAQKADTKRMQQVQIVFQLALETACRKGELLSLRWEHVHLARRYVHIPDTKTGKPRDVPLSSNAVRLLESVGVKDSGLVFIVSSSVFDQMFRRMRERAGLSGFTFHDTRHTAVTRLAQKLSVLELARMVGHSDPRSLMWYYNESAEQLARKLD